MNTSSPTLTPAGRQVLALAREEAARWNHSTVFTQHLLLGCIRFGKGRMARILADSGLDLETVCQEYSRLVEVGPVLEQTGRIPFGPKVNQLLASVTKQAAEVGRAYVGAEHILMALLRETDGINARVLKNLNVDVEKLHRDLLAAFDPHSGR